MKYISFLLVGSLLLMQGCYKKVDDNNDDRTTTTNPVTTGDWYRPALKTKWSWQNEGNIEIIDNVSMYVVDLFTIEGSDITAIHDGGHKVMCVFHSAQVNISDDNSDPDQEKYDVDVRQNYTDDTNTSKWLDISQGSVRDNLTKRIDIAQEKGCDGVVPTDTYMYNISGTGVTFDSDAQKKYNIRLANYAHDQNLTVGLKDDKSQIFSLVEYYDFALTRDCYALGHCDAYEYFVEKKKPVFDTELNTTYPLNSTIRNTMCADANKRKYSTIVVTYDLNGTYRDSCN